VHAEIKHVDDIAIVRLRGKITIGAGEIALRNSVHHLVSQGHKYIILDLREVAHLDSSGGGELVSAYATAANNGAKLGLIVRPKGNVWNYLEITQMSSAFRLFFSEEEAIEAIKNEGFAEFYQLNIKQE
jgi:anti-sigma B factor antagonist